MIPRSYTFKTKEEFFWFVFLALAMPVLAALESLDLSAAVDWRLWIGGLIVAGLRALIGALIAFKTGGA